MTVTQTQLIVEIDRLLLAIERNTQEQGTKTLATKANNYLLQLMETLAKK